MLRGARVGKAKNPGPETPTKVPCPTNPSVLQFNSGGAPGLWRLYEENFCGHHIVLIQECGMSPEEWNSFAAKAATKGYKGYYQIGNKTRAANSPNWFNGGVATLIHQNVKHKFDSSLRHFSVQVISVWVGRIRLINMYVPPDNQFVGLDAVTEFFETNNVDRQNWIVMGDFNELPTTGEVPTFLRTHRGHLVGTGLEPTRWNGERCIDFAFSKPHNLLHDGGFLTSKLSDHKGNVYSSDLKDVLDNRIGRLKPTPSWTKPEDIPTEAWQEALETAWKRVTTGDPLFKVLTQKIDPSKEQGDPRDVQLVWDEFNRFLRETFMGAFQDLINQGQTEMVTEELRKLMTKPGRHHKGCTSQFQWYNNGLKNGNHLGEGEKLRKTRRRLARLYEARKCCERGILPPKDLGCKLGQRIVQCHNLNQCLGYIETDIQHFKQLQMEEENKLRNDRFKRWRKQVQDPSIKGLARWVRKKENPEYTTSICYKDVIAENRPQTTQMIFDFWTDLWEDQNVSQKKIAEKLISDFGIPLEQTEWELGIKDVWQAVRNAHGACGTDGWTGEEIKHIPTSAIHTFFDITRHWEQMGRVPMQLLESRQINIPKTHKVDDSNHTCKVEHLRPLSVLSVWWRCYSSAWARSQATQQWAKNNLHKAVAHGKGASGAEDLADYLQSLYSQNTSGFLATLDWSQAFDRISPEATVATLEKLNFAPRLVRTLKQVWGQQKRYICFNQHVHHEMLSPKGIPQGCPISPLILAIWVTAGLRNVQNATHHSPQLHAVYSCYMDDRSFWGKSMQCIQTHIRLWHDWSSSVALKENVTKTAITAKGKRAKTELGQTCPQWKKDEIQLLGVSTVSGPRANTPEENARILAAEKRAFILKSAKLGWSQSLRAFQYLVTPKVNYGWIGRDPKVGVTEKLFSELSRCAGTNYAASRNLRKFWYGATTHLQCAVTLKRWCRVKRLLQTSFTNQVVIWNSKPHTSVRKLRRNLKDLNFQEVRPWVWKAQGQVKNADAWLNLTNPKTSNVDLQKHVIREAFRRVHLYKWVDQNRRDARKFREALEEKDVLFFSNQLDTHQLRKKLHVPQIRALLLGSFWSNAALSMAKHNDLREGKCHWCSHECGHLRHVLWECPLNPAPCLPQNPLELLGWCNQPYLQNHLIKTIQEIWDVRHDGPT